MPRQVALLRGINLGASNRVAMAALRDALADAGFGAVCTHAQSGNVVLDSDREADDLAGAVAQVLSARFGLDVPVVIRTAVELADAVAANPFTEEAGRDPKRLQVTFRDAAVEPDALVALRARAGTGELVAAAGRELYSWHPEGIAGSKLALALAPRGSGATARNWLTVTALLDLAAEG